MGKPQQRSYLNKKIVKLRNNQNKNSLGGLNSRMEMTHNRAPRTDHYNLANPNKRK